jgi:hypothetical protein
VNNAEGSMRTTLLLVPLLLAATAAFAAPDVKTACMADYLALCPSVAPGGGRVVACMKEHRAKVSAACKLAVLQHIAEKRGLGTGEEIP